MFAQSRPRCQGICRSIAAGRASWVGGIPPTHSSHNAAIGSANRRSPSVLLQAPVCRTTLATNRSSSLSRSRIPRPVYLRRCREPASISPPAGGPTISTTRVSASASQTYSRRKRGSSAGSPTTLTEAWSATWRGRSAITSWAIRGNAVGDPLPHFGIAKIASSRGWSTVPGEIRQVDDGADLHVPLTMMSYSQSICAPGHPAQKFGADRGCGGRCGGGDREQYRCRNTAEDDGGTPHLGLQITGFPIHLTESIGLDAVCEELRSVLRMTAVGPEQHQVAVMAAGEVAVRRREQALSGSHRDVSHSGVSQRSAIGSVVVHVNPTPQD
jgi:hypothetical protein